MDERLLTWREVALYLGVCKATVERYGKLGILTRVTWQEKPRRVGYRLSEVQARQLEIELRGWDA